jgi:hypothetical protein
MTPNALLRRLSGTAQDIACREQRRFEYALNAHHLVKHAFIA